MIPLRLFRGDDGDSPSPEAEAENAAAMQADATPPPLPRKRRPKRLPEFLSLAEQDKLLAWCAAEPDKQRAESKKRSARLDMLLLHLGLFMGLRVSEWCNLDVQHLDLVARTALIKQAKGSKDRYVPIPLRSLPILVEWIAGREQGPLITMKDRRVDDRTLYHRIKRAGRLCGLVRRLHPHVLRHTFATRLHQQTGDLRMVQDLLGHASIATTQVYLHCDPSRALAAVDLL
jgi:integrase/recombinase XerD